MEKYYLDEPGLKRLVDYIAVQLKSRDNAIEDLIERIKENDILNENIIFYGGSASEVLEEEE